MLSLLVLLSALLHLTSASCAYGTSLHKRAEGAVPEAPAFGYTDLLAPHNWAGLSPENIDCSAGINQSPINLNAKTATILASPPKVNIPSVEAAEFENLGTTVEVIVNGTTELPGREGEIFELKQFHFHSPSEHRIEEEYFPLEVHMVHESATGEIAVIALLFQMSGTESTPLVQSAITKIAEIQTVGTVTETGPLDFAPLIKHLATTPLMTYKGSLTTPPCAEGLTFVVTQQPLPLDVETFNSLKSTLKFNSRYTQNVPGKENILQVGCAAVDAAAAALGVPGAEGGEKAEKVEGIVTPPALGAPPKGLNEMHHCIMGACNKH